VAALETTTTVCVASLHTHSYQPQPGTEHIVSAEEIVKQLQASHNGWFWSALLAHFRDTPSAAAQVGVWFYFNVCVLQV
jgi:hypothetical protein